MKYGLARNIQVYNIDTQKGGEVISTTGDYLQAQMWMDKHMDGYDSEIKDVLQAYAWAYFALKRNGRLKEFGISEELTDETLLEMANVVTVYLEQIEDGSLPLANQPKK